MASNPSVELAADQLAQLPLEQARTQLAALLAEPFTQFDDREFARGLTFNAQLVTALRDRKVRIWGGHDQASDSPCAE